MINKSASVRARLLNKAKSENQDFSLVLTRYGLERLLYRLREMLSPCAKSQGPGPSVDSATSRRMTRLRVKPAMTDGRGMTGAWILRLRAE